MSFRQLVAANFLWRTNLMRNVCSNRSNGSQYESSIMHKKMFRKMKLKFIIKSLKLKFSKLCNFRSTFEVILIRRDNLCIKEITCLICMNSTQRMTCSHIPHSFCCCSTQVKKQINIKITYLHISI